MNDGFNMAVQNINKFETKINPEPPKNTPIPMTTNSTTTSTTKSATSTNEQTHKKEENNVEIEDVPESSIDVEMEEVSDEDEAKEEEVSQKNTQTSEEIIESQRENRLVEVKNEAMQLVMSDKSGILAYARDTSKPLRLIPDMFLREEVQRVRVRESHFTHKNATETFSYQEKRDNRNDPIISPLSEVSIGCTFSKTHILDADYMKNISHFPVEKFDVNLQKQNYSKFRELHPLKEEIITRRFNDKRFILDEEVLQLREKKY